ncbi:MAG: exodeoxyribonuclease V subunit beta, partial [Actinomycetota bacterium]|nr:exodeoxyribonuclease V subunit beta [Actinomycetota bacterium]
AIYAFRGADVHAYLAAAEIADHRATLTQNWRSDPDLLRGLDAVFRGAALGDPRIVVASVSAGHSGRCLSGTGAAGTAPVQIRVISEAHIPVGKARDLVTADVVREVVDLLGSGRVLTPRDGSPPRPVLPGDIAVVVRSAKQLTLVHGALLAAGVPSVQRTTSSVFRTPAGADWVVLLEALEQPHRTSRVRRLAITSFVGWDAAGLEANDLDELGLRLRRWQHLLADRGIAALLEAVTRDEALTPRLLGQFDGERLLTDLRHVGEALHAAATTHQFGLTATLEWLRRRVDEADRDTTTERSRRLDSDADAVQVVTVHASKGLEFPIVLVPFGWDRHVFDTDIPLFHDAQGRRVRNVGGRAPGFLEDGRRHNAEEFGEDLRLIYVAFTRAQAQVTAWWAASSYSTDHAPLHRLLFADNPAQEVPERVTVPRDSGQALNRFAALAVDDCLAVTEAVPREPRRWVGPAAPTRTLTVAVLDRSVDTSWRRTSYSALTQGAHDASLAIGSEPEATGKTDEPPPDEQATPTALIADELSSGDATLRQTPSPMAELSGGAAFGTLVHAVLEHVDPTSTDLAAEVHEHTQAMIARYGAVGPASATELAQALLPALRTPMGPLAGGRALADIAPADRLTELDFELPLCGGERPNGFTRLRDLAPLLRDHLPADDPMRAYADLLEDPIVGEQVLR